MEPEVPPFLRGLFLGTSMRAPFHSKFSDRDTVTFFDSFLLSFSLFLSSDTVTSFDSFLLSFFLFLSSDTLPPSIPFFFLSFFLLVASDTLPPLIRFFYLSSFILFIFTSLSVLQSVLWFLYFPSYSWDECLADLPGDSSMDNNVPFVSVGSLCISVMTLSGCILGINTSTNKAKGGYAFTPVCLSVCL